MLTPVAAAGCHDQESPAPTEPQSEASLPTTAAALSFFQMSAGLHSCGITADSRLYCWGSQGVGDGTDSTRLRPVPIAGSLRFKLVSAKNSHSCAITTDARLFCWGDNSFGQLGDGTTTTRLTPHQVSGNRAYRQVDVGRDHTCAIAAADDRAYCWGANTGGQLGIGVHDARKLTPTLVAGGGQYKQVQAGLRHSCAVTTANQAFCWGYGRDGQIGDGKTALRFWPRAVAGGLTFRRVSTGRSHACGETPSDKVYCWGNNPFGGIGDGTMGQDRLRPVAVVGGLSFSQVAAGLYSTCGRTPSGVGYCWGFNGYGQLGDGTETNRSEPVKVADPAG